MTEATQFLDDFASSADVVRAANSYGQLVEADRRRVIEATAIAARNGNQASLDLLLLLLDQYRLLIPVVRRVIADNGLAEEVVQDVLIIVAESIGTFRAESTFRTWLFGVARNQARHHLRSYLRQPQPGSVDVTDERPTQRISSMVAHRHDLELQLAKLPEHYRQPVMMRDIEAQPYDAIAEKLAIELGTVRSRISRGRALLAAQLAAT